MASVRMPCRSVSRASPPLVADHGPEKRLRQTVGWADTDGGGSMHQDQGAQVDDVPVVDHAVDESDGQPGVVVDGECRELATPADALAEPLEPLPKPKAAATLAGGLAAERPWQTEEPHRAVVTGLDHAGGGGLCTPSTTSYPPALARRDGVAPLSLPPARHTSRTETR